MKYKIPFFVSSALVFNWRNILNLCPDQMTRNEICPTAATVLFTCYRQNEIKYSPYETARAAPRKEDCAHNTGASPYLLRHKALDFCSACKS